MLGLCYVGVVGVVVGKLCGYLLYGFVLVVGLFVEVVYGVVGWIVVCVGY